MKTEWKKYSAVGFVALVVVLIVFFVTHYWGQFTHAFGVVAKALTPFAVGMAMAYLLNIPMAFYEKHFFPRSRKPAMKKLARPVCATAAVLTLLIVVAMMIGLIVLEVISNAHQLFTEIFATINAFIESLLNSELVPESVVGTLQEIDWRALAAGATGVFNLLSGMMFSTTGTADAAVFEESAAASLAPAAVNLVMGAFFAVCLLLDKERLQMQCARLLNYYIRPSRVKKLRRWLAVTDECFHTFIVRRCGKAVVVGTLCTVGLLFFGFPFAMTVGSIVGVAALFPIAGACVGAAAGAAIIFGLGSPLQAALFLLYLAVLYLLEDKLLYPKLADVPAGRLSFTWHLLAVTVGGGVWGIPGLLIGIPLAETSYRLIKGNMAPAQTAE